MAERAEKDFSLKVRGSVDETGKFSGLGAYYSNVDLGGDRILPGAFAKALAERTEYPLLWNHDSSVPLGSVKVADSPQGLAVEGELLLDVPQAQNIYQFLKKGIVRGLSIGYDVLKSDWVGGVRELKEIKLWELSLTLFPMNEAALVASVKSFKAMSDAERGQHLKAIDHHRRAIDRHQRAMRENMKALFGDEMFADDDDQLDDQDLLLDEGNGLDESEAKELALELNKMLEMVRA